MLGCYDNFPENIHRIENFNFSLSSKKLQERFVQVLYEMNKTEVSSEEIDHRALHECTIFFETGIAESESFNYLNEEEMRKLREAVKKAPLRVMDFFFAARYYKTKGEKKTPLKFDYYIVRTVFGENSLEMRIFHERGPRYTSPEDVVHFLVERTNNASAKKILKPSQ